MELETGRALLGMALLVLALLTVMWLLEITRQSPR